ncbi:hypothetical protein [Ruegeria sp. HKCCA5426]|uniref:hypothetical protein n=1 Tax=Ruegeria sp. HKCCA5426 TaxID=2682985 RepID=UPI001488ED54|nr:hypothetical protein [Ruegeria sp. HKCCA5426]
MTDKVVNGSVEDVLSSIKRLVGEEGRKIPDLVPTAMSRKPGRLVLTDALRVSEAAEDEDEAEPKAEYTADASIKPMVLRASDIVKRDEPVAEEHQSTDPADSLSAKIEALEAAIARTEDQWEPDGDSEDEYSGTRTTSLEWSADEEASSAKEDVRADNDDSAPEAEPQVSETKAMFIRDPEVTAAAVSSTEQPRDVTALDEAALRDLIAQVVREELQGVLGERITRNVRKMVRREIYRALAEHKPD